MNRMNIVVVVIACAGASGVLAQARRGRGRAARGANVVVTTNTTATSNPTVAAANPPVAPFTCSLAAAGATPEWSTQTCQPTGQWSLQEREYWAALNEELAGYVRDARTNCGTNAIVATYDHETFRGRMTNGGSYGLGIERNCVSVVQAIRDICVQSPAGAAAVRAANVHLLICSFGRPGYAFSGGVGRMTMDGNSVNGSGLLNQWSEFVKTRL